MALEHENRFGVRRVASCAGINIKRTAICIVLALVARMATQYCRVRSFIFFHFIFPELFAFVSRSVVHYDLFCVCVCVCVSNALKHCIIRTESAVRPMGVRFCKF